MQSRIPIRSIAALTRILFLVGRKLLMKNYFICSLCHNGVLGGGLIVDEHMLNYKTGKVTVESKYRDLVLNRDGLLDSNFINCD